MRASALSVMTAVLCLLVVVASSHANYLGSINLDYSSTVYLAHNVRAYVTMDYSITNSEGARISVEPRTNGSHTPYYSWSGCPILPEGTGAICTWFSITQGDVWVDQYRIAMYTPDWSEVLVEIILPVSYHYGEHGVYDIELGHEQPSWLGHGQELTVNFNHKSSETGGVRISARPYTDGNLTPGYIASGMPLLPPEGSGSQWFRFDSGEVEVDSIRIRMYDAEMTETLLEFFIPVEYYWGPHGLYDISVTPAAPEYLPHGQRVEATIDYFTSDPAGVRIWMLGAAANGQAIPNQHYCGSTVLPPPSGTITRWFYFDEGEVDVEQILIFMTCEDHSETYVHVLLPTYYHYGPHAIYNLQFAPDSPAILDNDERVDISFDYTTVEAGGVRIFDLPFSGGSSAPNAWVNPSPLYPVGSGSGSGYYGISSGEILVDQVRFWMTDADQNENFLDYFFATQHFWGTSGIVVPVPEPAPPAGPQLDQNYPNPFNPKTTIRFALQASGHVNMMIYDVRGRVVRDLFSGSLGVGEHSLVWDGRNDRGESLASGIYFSRLEAGEQILCRKMLLLK